MFQALVIFVVGLTGLAFWRRELITWFIAGTIWIILGFEQLIAAAKPPPDGMVNYWLGLFCIVTGSVLFLYGTLTREKPEVERKTVSVNMTPFEKNYEARMDKLYATRNRMRRGTKKDKSSFGRGITY